VGASRIHGRVEHPGSLSSRIIATWAVSSATCSPGGFEVSLVTDTNGLEMALETFEPDVILATSGFGEKTVWISAARSAATRSAETCP